MYFVENQGAEALNEAITLRVISNSGADENQLRHLVESSRLHQIIIIKTEKYEPLASIAFARISKYTLRLLIKNPEHRLQTYEYNEGKILFIVDAFFTKNNFKKSISMLISELNKHRLVAYVKNKKVRIFYNNNGTLKYLKLPVLCV